VGRNKAASKKANSSKNGAQLKVKANVPTPANDRTKSQILTKPGGRPLSNNTRRNNPRLQVSNMSHKKKHGATPVPRGNRAKSAPNSAANQPEATAKASGNAGFQEQDPKRRLGNFSGAGEHPYQQPGGRNDANH